MKKIKILIVDDGCFMREMIKKYLDREKFEVIEAKNGFEAIDLYKKHNPFIVSMDITMPEMDGKQALKLIKEYDKSANIMMSTAIGQSEDIKECVLYGCNNYLVKPYTKETYLDRVNQMITKGILSKKCPYDEECTECEYIDICRIEK